MREREKKVREGSGVRAHPEEHFKKTINNQIFKSEIETAFKKKKKSILTPALNSACVCWPEYEPNACRSVTTLNNADTQQGGGATEAFGYTEAGLLLDLCYLSFLGNVKFCSSNS